MIIGVLRLDLYLPSALSLKDKRAILRMLKDRIKNGFNVSVAEVDALDKWQRAVVGITTAGNDKQYINGLLDKIVDLVQGAKSVELLDYQIEII